MSNLATVSSSKLSASTLRKLRVAGMLEASICGIPCLIDVLTCTVVKGSFSYNAPSDYDYLGYNTVEFDVYDRKGYAANWLSNKMTEDDRNVIEAMILDNNSQNDYDD